MHWAFENLTDREATILRVFCLHLADKIGMHVLNINTENFEDNIRILALADVRKIIKETANDFVREPNG